MKKTLAILPLLALLGLALGCNPPNAGDRKAAAGSEFNWDSNPERTPIP